MVYRLSYILLSSFLYFLAGTGMSHGDETRSDTAVVARVGDYRITVENLLESYEITPSFVKLSANPLETHLRYLIYEYLLASEAEQRGYDTLAITHRMIQAIEEDLTVDQLYQDDILSQVTLTEENINAGVQKGRIRIRLRWIFSESIVEAHNIYRKYTEGASFDSLFYRHLPPDTPPESRMYENTQLILERDNPGLMNQIVHLKSQEVSEPVEGADGYYIFRIEEIRQNPILPLDEYTKLKDQATTVLTKIRADEISRRYIQGLFDEENPEIVPAGMYVIRAYLAGQGLTEEQIAEYEIPLEIMTEGGPKPVIHNPEFLSLPVARNQHVTVTVQDYLDWFEIRQLQIRRHSREAFNTSILQTVRKMMQDRMLSDRAYERGLHERKTVRSELQRWKAKILYSVFRRTVQQSIDITAEHLRSYYNAHSTRYVGGEGNQLSFEDARDYVYGDLYLIEENRVLYRLLRELETKYDVSVDETLFESLAETIDETEIPVNVIFYKPGGTFPRVAFPTIDQLWRNFAH
jgi:hypothetical protein